MEQKEGDRRRDNGQGDGGGERERQRKWIVGKGREQ